MNNARETSNLDDLKQVVIIILFKTKAEQSDLVSMYRLDEDKEPKPIRWSGDRKLQCDARTDVDNLIFLLMEIVTGQNWLLAEKDNEREVWYRVDYHHSIEQCQVREQA